MDTFSLQVGADGNLIGSGELTASSITPEMCQRTGVLLKKVAGAISIDLSDVTRVDSVGVAVFVSWVRLAHQLKKTIHFSHLSPQMRDIIRVSGLQQLLPIK